MEPSMAHQIQIPTLAMTLCLVLICVVNFLPSNFAARSYLRIIEGRDAYPGEFPYVVRIENHVTMTAEGITKKKIEYHCTGAALKSTWTLSARHCIPKKFAFRTNNKNAMEEHRPVVRYGDPEGKPSKDDSFSLILKCEALTDKRYRKLIFDDIALFNTEPVVIDKYAKISAIDFKSLSGHAVTVVGHGLMKASSTKLNNTLYLQKPLQVIDKAMVKSCDAREGSVWKCMYPAISLVVACGEMKMHAFGDSGAPILHTSGIIGVISGGELKLMWDQKSFSRSKTLGSLVPVSPYLNWILNITSN